MEWVEEALCKNLHIDLFYPPLELKDPNSHYSVAKAVCTICPVWEYCIDMALHDGEKWGCWGGTTPQERRSPSKVPHGTRERYRLGCSCDDCFTAESNKENINLRKVPQNGQHFDISELLFDLFRE